MSTIDLVWPIRRMLARQAAALPGGLGIGRRVVGLEGPEERELVRDDERLVADERSPVAGLGRCAAQAGAVGRHRREDAVERVAVAVGVLVSLRSLAHAEGREGVARGQDRARRRGGRLEHGALRVGEAVGRGLDDLHHLVERVAVAVAVAHGREGRERVAQRLDLLVGGDRRQAGAHVQAVERHDRQLAQREPFVDHDRALALHLLGGERVGDRRAGSWRRSRPAPAARGAAPSAGSRSFRARW